jgi:AraC-like DNA-binding protein/quercetin dioxygenase-like cupin family protein
MAARLRAIGGVFKDVRFHRMSPNGQPALQVGAFPMEAGARFHRHTHPRHQLVWTDAGVLEVITATGTWVLPPTRALWVPAGTEHETVAVGATVLRGAYVEPSGCPITWDAPQALAVGELLAALLLHLGDDLLNLRARERAEAVLLDLLAPVDVVTIELTMPRDERARELADGLLADPADQRTLAEWGRAIGASSRTLTRCFLADTGISFTRWRTAARMRAALPRLADGEPISRVADAVGYETASAFVAAFRRETGTTPGAYFRAR